MQILTRFCISTNEPANLASLHAFWSSAATFFFKISFRNTISIKHFGSRSGLSHVKSLITWPKVRTKIRWSDLGPLGPNFWPSYQAFDMMYKFSFSAFCWTIFLSQTTDCCTLTTKAQISLHICTDCSVSLLFAYCKVYRSRDMRSPTMWHFDKCRLRPACEPHF